MMITFSVEWMRRIVAATATAALAGHSAAAVDSFIFRQVVTSQDGDRQVIELIETGNRNFQDQFAGLTLTSTDPRGTMKSFVFPANLPSTFTAGKHVVIVSKTEADAGGAYDFVMPDRFVPTDGATLTLGVGDRWSFGALPNGGNQFREEVLEPNGLARTFDGRPIRCCAYPSQMREYYNERLDQYFMTSMAPDIEALESGRLPGWELLGTSFQAMSFYGDGEYQMLPSPTPVCRYLIPPSSHFYSVSPDECAEIAQRYPNFELEIGNMFYAYAPDAVTGECPTVANENPIPTRPLYRLWNGRADTGHRYTMSLTVRARMLAQSWVAEGAGPDGVAMCVPVP